jgi:hypothetical protein
MRRSGTTVGERDRAGVLGDGEEVTQGRAGSELLDLRQDGLERAEPSSGEDVAIHRVFPRLILALTVACATPEKEAFVAGLKPAGGSSSRIVPGDTVQAADRRLYRRRVTSQRGNDGRAQSRARPGRG